ncbi:MAG: response regulator [Campylobacterota bacterium]|nr:response regulator [Campylobacterota bacterium]
MKIIILDDSLTIRMTIEAYLEDLDVTEDEMFKFENGHDALAFIKENGADMVFSDINMPLMNGYEFAGSVLSETPSLKKSFFAISGEENRESYKKMKNIGVHQFIKKPIKVEHFRHFVLPEILKIRARSI